MTTDKSVVRCPSCGLMAAVKKELKEYRCPQCHRHIVDKTHDSRHCHCGLTAIVHRVGAGG